MRVLLILVSVFAIAGLAFLGFRFWQFSRLWPRVSTEITQLTQEKRILLQRLRSEIKFLPHDYSPLGYTGAATSEDQARASLAVNDVIDAVLSLSDQNITAQTVSSLIGKGMQKVNFLETEDRDRTQDYMLEVWYILGFKGATGRFLYGSAYQMPDGYGEPLPPGWAAPDIPRPIR
jgi:hypothetical protein